MVSESFAWDVKVHGLPPSWLVGVGTDAGSRDGGGVATDRGAATWPVANVPARLPYDDHFDLFPGKVHWVTATDVLEQVGGRVQDLTGTAVNQLVRALQESLKMLMSGRN